MGTAFRDAASRAGFIRAVVVTGAVAAGAGAALYGNSREGARAADLAAPACPDSLQTIINTALVAENLATTFYYAALTSVELMSDSQLGGSSIDPNHPGLPPNGNPANVRFLQAALDAEVTHAAALVKAGAQSTTARFYFPANTFKPTCVTGQVCTLGNSDNPGTFLGVLDALETAFVGAYLAAIRQFVVLGYPALAEVGANIVGVESEHRALGRIIADAYPANNLTLERLPFACLGDAATALRPFLTGEGFTPGATPAIPLPTPAQIARVVGVQRTRIVASY